MTAGLSATAWAIIIVGFAIGGGAGLYTARSVKMTAMPQLVSLFNAVGGGAAALVAIEDFIRLNDQGGASLDTTIFVVLGALIGSVTFSGSLIAGGKLQGLIPGKPIYVPGGRLVTILAGGRRRRRDARPGARRRPARSPSTARPRWRSSRSSSSPAWSSASRWCCRSAARTCPSSSAC